jgi:CRP-like cAMP-binding protein
MSTRLDALRSISIFGGVADQALGFLDGHLEPVSVAAGETFFVQGDLGDSLFVLDEGRAEVVKSRDGRSLVLATLGPADCFGEIALIGICPRTATVRAVTDCRALRLSSRVLLQLYRDHPKAFTLVQMNLGREIARRLAALDDVVFEIAAAPHGGERLGRIADTQK